MCDRDIGSGGDKATMCKKGSCLCSEVTTSEPTGEDWILSTGDKVYWYVGEYGNTESSELIKIFEACSGKIDGEETIDSVLNFKRPIGQNSKDQHRVKVGPTVTGHYKLDITHNSGKAPVSGSGEYAVLTEYSGKSIEIIPDEYPKLKRLWGNKRVRLRWFDGNREIAPDRNLNSFYFHDSQKGETDGCIEVDSEFFVKLEEYRDKMRNAKKKEIKIRVQVKYPSSNHVTKSTKGYRNEKR